MLSPFLQDLSEESIVHNTAPIAGDLLPILRAVCNRLIATLSYIAILQTTQCLKLPWLSEITQTALVSAEKDLPAPTATSLDDPEESAARAATVWVPNRNGVFVAVGASFAESLGADTIVAGFNAEEEVLSGQLH